MRVTQKQLEEIAKNVGLRIGASYGRYEVWIGNRRKCTGTAKECWIYCDGFGDGKQFEEDRVKGCLV